MSEARKFREAFARRVYERRWKLGLTQEQVAKKTRISRPSIANIESARQLVPLNVLARLAKALSCRMSYLLGETSRP